MATLTSTSWTYQPLQSHEGLNCATFYYNSGATVAGSVGDRVLLTKIPHGATIVDAKGFLISGATANNGSFLLVKGKTASATTTLFHLSLTVSSTVALAEPPFTATNRVPFKVSLSDDDGVQYANVVFVFQTATNSATTSVEVGGFIHYTMQGHGNT